MTNSIQINYNICSDSAGCAIIAWGNADSFSTTGYDIYVQKIDSLGDLSWGTTGTCVTAAPGNQGTPIITSDENGGAIICSGDERVDIWGDLYAWRIDGNGNVMWEEPICTTSNTQGNGWICSYGVWGGIIVWYDLRNSNETKGDIYAQRVDSAGNVRWQVNGVPVCTDSAQQDVPVVESDGLGGAVIAWYDTRGVGGSSTQGKIYAQRLDSLGDSEWALNGVAVCTADSSRSWPGVIMGKPGNAIVSWFDFRHGNWDIYAQCLDSLGGILWTLDGIPVCEYYGTQFNFIYNRQNQSIYDGSQGVIMVWHDNRGGNYDVYAQKVNGLTGVAGEPSAGPGPVRMGLRVWPNPFCGQAMVEWAGKDGEIRIYDIRGRLVEKTRGRVIGNDLGSGVYFAVAQGYNAAKLIKLK